MPLLPNTGLHPNLELAQRSWRWLSRLPWGLWMLVLGAAVLVVMLAAHSAPSICRTSIDAAGFLLYYGTILATGFLRIKKVEDRPTRIALLWAFTPFAAGAVLIPVALLIFVYNQRLGTRLVVAGSVLLLASVVVFGLASAAVDAINLLGLATGISVCLSLLAGVFLFPPVIVFLLSDGHWPSFLLGPQANNGWMDLISIIPLAALFVLPDLFLRKVHEWEYASPKARRIVPGWIASIALIFTCLYAFALHYSHGNPLTATPLPGIVLATLFVGVILWPLYKNIAASFWQFGIADAVKLKDWRHDQKVVGEELQRAIRNAWHISRMTYDGPVAMKNRPSADKEPHPHLTGEPCTKADAAPGAELPTC